MQIFEMGDIARVCVYLYFCPFVCDAIKNPQVIETTGTKAKLIRLKSTPRLRSLSSLSSSALLCCLRVIVTYNLSAPPNKIIVFPYVTAACPQRPAGIVPSATQKQ